MAPVTTSAINKSKTVAPKAVARRRPGAGAGAGAAPPPPPPPPPPSPPPVSAPLPTPVPASAPNLEQDAVAGASRVESQSAAQSTPPSAPPLRQPQPSPSTTTATTNARQPISSLIPSPDAVPAPAPAPASTSLPTPPASQTLQSIRQQPSVSQPSVSPPQPQTAAPPLATPIQHDAALPVSTSARPPSPTITSPAPIAGAKRKRITHSTSSHPPEPSVQPAPAQEPVDHVAPVSQTSPASDATSTQALPTDSPASQNVADAQAASAAPVAQMISPERTRKRAPPKPTMPKVTSRAKRQKKTLPTETSPSTDQPDPQPIQSTESPAATATAPKPKKPRAKRQPKSAARIVEDEDGNAIDEPEQDKAEKAVPKQRKPRQPRKPKDSVKKKQKKTDGGAEGEDEGENEDEDEESEDPELHEIDPNAVKMSDLTRDRRLGKQSERETKMAAIDWEEVARKRLEVAQAIAEGRAVGEQSQTRSNNEAAQEGAEGTPQPRAAPISGPRLRMDADGNMVVDEESLRIDRQAQAEANAANFIVTEEDDLTKRVNQMSWISERKQDPTDRVPFFKMKSDPWSEEETDRFFEALKMFGTDFFIISKMFHPKTRRQIKLKFVREERLDPDRVNRALSGESTVPMSINHFAEATGQEVQNFKDPRELEEELRQEGEKEREEIARKKKEFDESKKQKEIQDAARAKDLEARNEQRRRKIPRKRGGVYGTGAL